MPVSDTGKSIQTDVLLPVIPAVAVAAGKVHLLTEEGELKTLPLEQAKLILHGREVLVCHGPFTRSRIGLEDFLAFDLSYHRRGVLLIHHVDVRENKHLVPRKIEERFFPPKVILLSGCR